VYKGVHTFFSDAFCLTALFPCANPGWAEKKGTDEDRAASVQASSDTMHGCRGKAFRVKTPRALKPYP
jgi:hypothetical protein